MNEYKKTRLANGLRVLTKQINLPQSNIYLFVKAGSKFENSKNNGISHLIEHLFLNSLSLTNTDKNGHTSKELTAYKFTQDQKYTLDNLKKICSAFYDPKFIISNDLRKTIIQEIPIIKHECKELKNNKTEQRIEYEHNLFQNNLKLPILGKIGTLQKLKYEDFTNYYYSKHVPKNAIIVIESNIHHQKIADHIKLQNYNHKIRKIVGGFKNSKFLIFFIISKILDKKNIANFYLPYNNTGIFVILNKLKESNLSITINEFNDAKKKIIHKFLKRSQSSDYIEDIAYGMLYKNKSLLITDIFEKIKQITYEMVIDAYENLIYK